MTAQRACLLCLVLLAGCAKPADKLVLKPSDFSALAGWEAERHTEALAAFNASCGGIADKDDEALTGNGDLVAELSEWKETCLVAQQINTEDDAAARHFFEANFSPFTATNNGEETGLFTGYYEPLLHGSNTRHGTYAYPLYAPPGDEARGEYHTREEIDGGALSGRGLELVWVDDPVDAFFLHIQGSGRVQMEDGRILKLGYAGNNGQPYVAIGALLAAEGEIERENLSAPAIRAWLKSHPQEMWRVMHENPSYVFFRIIDGAGPIGSQGVALTAERSLAVDRNFIPLGTPIYLETNLPAAAGAAPLPYRRLVVAQDTGGAIKGPVRGDVFFGFGERAAELAGYMKQVGRYTLLLPKKIAARVTGAAQ